MVHIKYIVEIYLKPDDAEKFALWAWGSDFMTLPLNTIVGMEKWNELHGDKLKLDPYGMPENDIPKMIELWKKENENK